jgi:hypothetical protein
LYREADRSAVAFACALSSGFASLLRQGFHQDEAQAAPYALAWLSVACAACTLSVVLDLNRADPRVVSRRYMYGAMVLSKKRMFHAVGNELSNDKSQKNSLFNWQLHLV